MHYSLHYKQPFHSERGKADTGARNPILKQGSTSQFVCCYKHVQNFLLRILQHFKVLQVFTFNEFLTAAIHAPGRNYLIYAELKCTHLRCLKTLAEGICLAAMSSSCINAVT